jgi:Emfourin
MKITFHQSGGFAGFTQKCEIDTRTLPGAEAAEIENLVKIGGVLKPKTAGIIGFLKSRITFSRTGACDIFDYGISVESDGITYHVTFDDLTIPEGSRPLLDYLKTHARQQQI